MKTYKLLLILLMPGVFISQAVSQDDILIQLEEIAIIDQKIMMPMRDFMFLPTSNIAYYQFA